MRHSYGLVNASKPWSRPALLCLLRLISRANPTRISSLEVTIDLAQGFYLLSLAMPPPVASELGLYNGLFAVWARDRLGGRF